MTRTYEIDAPVARALDLLGERWTVLIVRQLLSGDQRYGDLYQSLYGISSNLLSARLRRLMQQGLVERVRLNGKGNRYRLTGQGEALAPVVWGLDAWARVYLDRRQPDLPLHDRCQQTLVLQWYCEHCRRPVEESELSPPPSL